MIEIRDRWNNAVIHAADVATVRDAVEDARAKGISLARADLADAYLVGANLVGAYLARAYLARADLAGANLARAYLADAYLARADLAGAYLARADLAGANLADAYLADAYLARADLAGAYLARADLAGANLARANLVGAYLARADLADALNVPAGTSSTDPAKPYERRPSAQTRAERAARYRELHPEVPVIPQLDAKILERIEGGGGTLQMDSWHTCETTHCRAGWAIHLAGEAGYALERAYDSQQAGAMIYRASTGRVPHFYATNERALEDIKRCAAEQLAAGAGKGD